MDQQEVDREFRLIELRDRAYEFDRLFKRWTPPLIALGVVSAAALILTAVSLLSQRDKLVSNLFFTIYIVAYTTLLPATAVVQKEVARRGWRRAPEAVIVISIATIVLGVVHLGVSAWIIYQWFTGQCSGTRFTVTVLCSMVSAFVYRRVPDPQWSRRGV
ncbi:hypothetical protein [Kitasatospora sp. NPDC088134]|uniref:hypothetical protein n=1 Tax=Kitasatospora sp. NPDC088134 TaxID=3364071 RepID=UPI0037FAE693